MCNPNTNQGAISIGTGTGVSSERCVSTAYDPTAGPDVTQDETRIINIRDTTPTAVFQADISGLDATNITIQVTANLNQGGARQIVWEAYAWG